MVQLAVILPQRCFRKARVEPVNADISLSVFMAHSHVFHTRAIFDRVELSQPQTHDYHNKLETVRVEKPA